ncbi:OLC1v1030099C1 [Oldenlandia corymbosa var. corymbosa]|uniref:RBR-type E3 ubiquitin transferase n=1 Tax=Oldenlandia corymbosa var. corymbosa TaxID=529605 RepID=A0AAV1CID9_OLDCO|nr:OLC1v1030099C1 [Oldenlandia corymbosa var. corymbosa]
MMSDDEDMSYDDDEYPPYDDDDDQGDYDLEEAESSRGWDEDGGSGELVEFSLLSGRDIRARVDAAISEISSFLSVSNEAALVLLCKHGWNVSRIHEEWFSDEAKIRKSSGLTVPEDSSGGAEVRGKGTFFCGICLENYVHNNSINCSAVTAACGHVYCENCWRTYVNTAIIDGAGSLFLRCPEPSCRASVAGMINSLASDENRGKYEDHVLRSFVESKKTIKYCPAPGCEFAIECLIGDGSNCKVCDYEVTCNCSYRLCWNCSEEAHSPVDCETVAKWILKRNSEAENTNWILANTKPCPKCKKWIQKNQGCMHMTCPAPCKFEFCWLCTGPWSEHGEKTGGFYSCNVYQEAKRNCEYNEQERIREMAKNSLQRYTHYYERWNSNRLSRKKVMADLDELPARILDKLSDIHRLTKSELQIITDAWVQVAECRRVLMWSYAYGYYLPENYDQAKKKFFEYLQGEAEFTLEKLHSLVEEELLKHTEEGASSGEYLRLQNNVFYLTRNTRDYFQNLVRALANGLQS